MTTLEQNQAQRPLCFPDPTANYIKLPETENLAQGKTISSGEHTDVYVNTNVNDGSTDTYWESKGFPAEMTIDLVSTDGEHFTEIAAAAKYDFNPDTGNRVRIDFGAVAARYVRVVFTMNSSSRTGGTQAAEIAVYE